MCQYLHGNIGVLRRSLQHTSEVRALLNEFVNMSSEHAPHKSRKMLDGSRKTKLLIPTTFKLVENLNKTNATLEHLGH